MFEMFETDLQNKLWRAEQSNISSVCGQLSLDNDRHKHVSLVIWMKLHLKHRPLLSAPPPDMKLSFVEM